MSSETPGRRLKAARVLQGLDQAELCTRAGISQVRLSQVENDQNLEGLRVGTLVRLCRALGVSVDYVVESIG